jgi:nucleotide-binding universal stress UspA family protein
MERTDIVVGYDGSAPSRTALRYAVSEARLRNAPVRVIAVFDYDWRGARFGGAQALELPVRQRIEAMVDEAIAETVAEVRVTVPDLAITGVARLGSPGPALLEASRTAALVVVGNRGHGGFGGLMLGSVSQDVATRANCPVIVVRGKVDTADGPVVVGADGSDRGDHTLGVAFEEAARRGAPLIAVRAYPMPAAYGLMALGGVPFDADDLKDVEAEALADSVRPWREKYPDVEVETLVARGSPGRVLVDVSSSAGLVVVGSHGHGAITATLLGSISLQVLHHADCPVLVARPDAG